MQRSHARGVLSEVTAQYMLLGKRSVIEWFIASFSSSTESM